VRRGGKAPNAKIQASTFAEATVRQAREDPSFNLQNPPESDPIKPNQVFEINPRRKGHMAFPKLDERTRMNTYQNHLLLKSSPRALFARQRPNQPMFSDQTVLDRSAKKT
jgi:hypothetical protein